MGILKEAFASDPLPEAAAPKQHEGISTTLQHSLRTLGILLSSQQYRQHSGA